MVRDAASLMLLLLATPALAQSAAVRAGGRTNTADCTPGAALAESSGKTDTLRDACSVLALRGDDLQLQADCSGRDVLIEGSGNLVAYALTRQGAVPAVTIRGEASRARRVTRLAL